MPRLLPRSLSRLTVAALVVTALAAAALYGSGTVRVVLTYGVSMLPTLQPGDLVVVARAADYEVGETVAYRAESLDEVVLHRIVAQTGDRFVLQGDNNTWLDLDRPRRDQVLGKQVLHVPSGGTWLGRLTSPPALTAYAFLLLAGGGAAARTPRERDKERRTVSPRHRATRRPATAGLPAGLKPVAAGTSLVGLTGLLLSGLAYARPAQQQVTASTGVTSSMDFSYSAQVPASPVYDGTTVTAPQPVFRALVDVVDVSYAYAGPAGTLSVVAELSAPSGWRATVPLSGSTAVGATHQGTVRLDLPQIEQRADAAAQVIGVPAGTVTVAVVPTVTLDGGGRFAPRLELALDDLALKSLGELTARETTSTSGTRATATRLSLFGRGIDVATARLVGPAAVALALLAGAVLAAVGRLSGPVAESERVRRRYRSLVLPVLPIALAPGRPVVDVPDVDSLATLAERYGLLVLTWSRGGVDTYVVQDEGTTYRYRHGGVSTSSHGSRLDSTVLPT